MNAARSGRFIAASILALICGTPGLIAKDSQQTEGFHLEMILQRNSGDPVENLKAGSFWIEQGGSRLQVAIANRGKQHAANEFSGTRVLVILGSLAPNPEDMLNRLTDSFKGLWKRGWETAVVRPDGSVTSYASGPASFQQRASTAISYDQAFLSAIASLGDFNGRRLVLYFPGSLEGKRSEGTPSTPPSLVQGAAGSMAMLYVVDGGAQAFIRYCDNTYTNAKDMEDEARACHPALEPSRSTFFDGVKHEPGSHMAFVEMRLDSQGYYDLYLTSRPGHSIDPHEPLSVKIKVGESFRTASQAYGIGKDIPIEVSPR